MLKILRPRFITLLIMLALTLSGCALFESKERAGLQVITDGVPSLVFLDGQNLDATPLVSKNLKPGQYQVRIEPTNPEYVPYETTLTLRRSTLTVMMWKPGSSPELSGGVIYEMEPLRSSDATEVVFQTIPEGAIISLEGREKEFSPAVFTDIAVGNREYEISLPSFEIQHHTISVQPGYRMIVNAKLAKLELPGEMDPEVSLDTELEVAPIATEPADLEETTTDQGFVRIKRTSYYVDEQEVIRVRAAPASNSRELKVIPVEQRYPYLGETENYWHKIDADGIEGWISGDFAVLELEE